MSRKMTQGCFSMPFGPISLLSPISLFFPAAISFLRFCRAVGMFIFFLFPVCCNYFIARSSLVFYLMEYSGEHDTSLHHRQVLRYRKLNCRNVCGSLGKQEMLWEQEVLSDCFNNFSVFFQTCTSYRNTTYDSCSSIF